MIDRIKSGDTIRIDNDHWDHLNADYFVHIAEYKENSTAVKLILEDGHSNIFTTTVAQNQIVKVKV